MVEVPTGGNIGADGLQTRVLRLAKHGLQNHSSAIKVRFRHSKMRSKATI